MGPGGILTVVKMAQAPLDQAVQKRGRVKWRAADESQDPVRDYTHAGAYEGA